MWNRFLLPIFPLACLLLAGCSRGPVVDLERVACDTAGTAAYAVLADKESGPAPSPSPDVKPPPAPPKPGPRPIPPPPAGQQEKAKVKPAAKPVQPRPAPAYVPSGGVFRRFGS